jgi:hypothetical protein
MYVMSLNYKEIKIMPKLTNSPSNEITSARAALDAAVLASNAAQVAADASEKSIAEAKEAARVAQVAAMAAQEAEDKANAEANAKATARAAAEAAALAAALSAATAKATATVKATANTAASALAKAAADAATKATLTPDNKSIQAMAIKPPLHHADQCTTSINQFLADHQKNFAGKKIKAHKDSAHLAKSLTKATDEVVHSTVNDYLHHRLNKQTYKHSKTTGMLFNAGLVSNDQVEKDPAHENHFKLKA